MRRLLGLVILLVGLQLGCRDDGSQDAEPPSPARPSGDLVAVTLVASGRAIVVAADGEIHFSDDGGEVWQRAHAPAADGMSDLAMADAERGWAVGHGAILRTEDGGASWRHQRLPGDASRMRLAAVAAIDADRAVALGAGGTRVVTRDGGSVWRDFSRPATSTAEAAPAVADIVCRPGGSGQCWAVGAEIGETRDGGESFRPAEIDAPIELAPYVFEFGRVEVDPAVALRWASAASSYRHRSDLHWRIEAGVGAQELERMNPSGDPAALFELVEARLEELRGILEEAGIDPDQIEVVAAPPWDFEETLDEDPGLLDRYWQGRTRARGEGRLRWVDDPALAGVAIDDAGRALAVGEGGSLFLHGPAGAGSTAAQRSEPQPSTRHSWRRGAPISPHALAAVAFGRGGAVVVGDQGALWLSADGGESWSRFSSESLPPFFESLRDVAFGPQGQLGLIVGERGRILRSRDGGLSWHSIGS